MKKIMSLVLVMILCFGTFAMAENAEIPTLDMGEVEAPYEENWIAFEDGVEISMPSDWLEAELPEGAADSGVFYAATNADASIAMSLGYSETEITDSAALATELSASFVDVGIITINGVEIVTYEASDSAYAGFCMLDGVGGLYTIAFKPVPESDFAVTAAYMMSTVGVYEDGEEVTDEEAAEGESAEESSEDELNAD